MHHWLTVVGACLALVGSLALGIELLKTKGDEAGEAEYRADQDEIEGTIRETVIGLRNMLSTQGEFVAGYLKILEEDLKPVFEPLLKDGKDLAFKADLALGILGRHKALEGLVKAEHEFASSIDPERALLLVREVQRRTEARFKAQDAKARRMRILATFGVVLVGIAAAAQLLDALLHS
jgi:hypothetical protein